MNKTNINTTLSTLNFILIFIGYQFVTTLFLPVSSDIEDISQQITIPYRAFALILSLTIIFINFRETKENFSIPLRVFLFFWVILIIRIFYDTNLRNDVKIDDMTQLWLYIFGIILPLIFSIIKSYKYINLNFALNAIFLICTIILIVTLFSNQALFVGDIDEGRQNANIALNTITFGHLGVTTVILGLFKLGNKELSNFRKLLIILVIVIGFFAMLRAGSRGPFFALGVVLFFWLFSKGKNFVKGFLIVLLFLAIIATFINPILDFIGYISPLMEERVRLSIFEGDSSERDPLYAAALNHFINNPFLGNQFALFEKVGLYEGNGTFIYSHNIILDAFMGMGIVGGLSMLYFLLNALKLCYRNIGSDDYSFWISLILIQQITSDMLSGAFYYDPLLSALLVFHFLYYNSKNKEKILFFQ